MSEREKLLTLIKSIAMPQMSPSGYRRFEEQLDAALAQDVQESAPDCHCLPDWLARGVHQHGCAKEASGQQGTSAQTWATQGMPKTDATTEPQFAPAGTAWDARAWLSEHYPWLSDRSSVIAAVDDAHAAGRAERGRG